MYSLTLTYAERRAFDWVGNRYSCGNAMSDLLIDCLPEDKAWSDEETLTFEIPEHTAWELAELADEDDRLFPCFADYLRQKMLMFLDQIV